MHKRPFNTKACNLFLQMELWHFTLARIGEDSVESPRRSKVRCATWPGRNSVAGSVGRRDRAMLATPLDMIRCFVADSSWVAHALLPNRRVSDLSRVDFGAGSKGFVQYYPDLHTPASTKPIYSKAVCWHTVHRGARCWRDRSCKHCAGSPLRLEEGKWCAVRACAAAPIMGLARGVGYRPGGLGLYRDQSIPTVSRRRSLFVSPPAL